MDKTSAAVAVIAISTLVLTLRGVNADVPTLEFVGVESSNVDSPNLNIDVGVSSSNPLRVDSTATEGVEINKMNSAPWAPSIEIPDLSKPVSPTVEIATEAKAAEQKPTVAEAKPTAPVAVPFELVDAETDTKSKESLVTQEGLSPNADTDQEEVKAKAKTVVTTPVEEAPKEKALVDKKSADKPASAAVKVAPPKIISKPKPRRPLTRDLLALKNRIEQCQKFYYNKPLNTGDDSCWSVMHSFLGFGVHTPLALRHEKGTRTNAIGWMCWNRSCAGYQLFYLQDGRIRTRQGPGYEGHKCQFLAMLAQVRVDKDYELRIQGQKFTVADLIEAEKLTCYPGEELTFKLIALAHYLPSDAEWTNDRGEKWSIPRLIREEISQKINGAACGGTHRLMGLSMAVDRRQFRGEPIDGEWARAADYVHRYHQYTLARLQNPDGSFSSDWFKKRSDWGDKDRQLQTTGHMLEWLVFSLPEERRRDPQVVKSVRFLTELMIRHRYHDWEVGPRGHALRTINLYYHLVLKDSPAMAKKPLNRIIRRSPR